ncbi:MAG TPA: helix-turn-helix domain-containing protein [Pyrinomonadaceae bacterium]|nr:helix-turn-helix domain-containing protein [Pyrinomonadaceae bacterium]
MAIKEENSIGFRIVQAFNAKDLKEVAQIIDENYSSLHNWASQRRDFPTNILIKIAKMANISIDWILTGENGNQFVSPENADFGKLLEDKIREVVREEISSGTAIHEKVQGIILAMQPNINEQKAFETTNKEEKAA